MKKITLSVLFCLFFVKAFSQLSRIDSMLVNINKTNFTNILYDRTTPWSKINTFNDSINISTKGHFEQALHELYKSSNEQKFANYKNLRTLYTPITIKNTVDVGIINTTFNELNYVENDEHQGALRVINNKFEKINNANPTFKTKHALIISPLKEKLMGHSVIFKFDDHFIFQETNRTIQSMVANFGTQQNYTIITNGTLTTNQVNINYTQEGLKTLVFNVTFTDGTTATTKSLVQSSFSTTAPPLVDNFHQIATDLFAGEYGEIEYRIFYHTRNNDGSTNYSQKTLLKPILIIDGFDPGDKRRIGYLEDNIEDDTLINLMYYQDANDETKNLVKKLREKGYDVVVVNQITHTKNGVIIDGGADYIERNAMAHVALYQHLNTTLTQNGSSEELVVMGPSMGGQISRYALAYMEKNNIAHNTRLWVSIDSPHLGANIPVGQQAMMDLLHAFGDSVAAGNFYNDRLKSVAGNQQLIEQHLPYQLPDHLNNGSPVRQQYLSNLTSNGLSGSNGYPQDLRKIAMVNGSLMGVNVDVAGTEDFRVHGFVKQLWWDVKVTEMNTNYMPNTGQTQQVARFWRQSKPKRTATFTNNNIHGSMDIVPGGLFNTEDELHTAVLGGDPGISNWGNGINIEEGLSLISFGVWGDFFSSRTNKEVHSFVPTISALGFKNSNFNWSQELDRNLICTGEIPFDNYYGPRGNTQHVSFTEESINWLFEELDTNTPYPNPTVYLDANDLIGNDIICATPNETYYFENCKLPSTPNWTVSSNLQIVSSTNNSVTVKAINSSIFGNGFITANFENQVVVKNIWAGRPNVTSHAILGGYDNQGINSTSQLHVDWADAATEYYWFFGNAGAYTNCAPNNRPKFFTSNGYASTMTSSSRYVTVNWGTCTGGFVVNCKAVNNCGMTGISYKNVQVYNPNDNIPDPCDQNPWRLKTFPNPIKKGSLTVVNKPDPGIPCNERVFEKRVLNSVEIYDFYGVLVYKGSFKANEFTIEGLNLKTGHYALHVTSLNGETLHKLITVE